MNNSVLKTKNTWQDGLVMDFSPDNTSATTLTAALNATFITNNGNDMSLQNDMGNGRVETAYLPEGYIPVGTCEFGDIIYIVSYNPLTNKSLIGCFPSPERNISSEELHNFNQSISAYDFLEFKNGNPTGKLKTTSVKKVLIDKKKLNPGDKYIVYTDNKECLTSNAAVLSNWNQSLDPKYIKLSIVSIEDGGKITYLDSTTKWYDIDDEKYKISYSQNNKITGKDDIDSYRNMLNSGWSILSSKVSGKLAILAELETIDTFSCYYIIKDIKDKKFENLTEEEKELGYNDKTLYKEYNVWIAYSSESSNGLNPSYLCLTKSQFPSSTQTYNLRNPEFLHQQYVSSLENGGIIKLEIPLANDSSGWIVDNNINEFELGTFIIPYSEDDYKIQSPDFVYSFQITPAMDFGRLDHLAVDMTIDFNKIRTGEVNITKWRYHNSGNTSILQYGLDVYSKPGWKVDDVSIEFYDNTGLAGIYYVNNKESYTGIFTEYLGLNGENINSKFSRYKSNGDVIGHKGLELSEKPEELSKDFDPTKDNPLVWNESYVGEYLAENNSIKWYQNDAGTLYSNILYLAKISIKQSKGLDTKSKEDDETSTDIFYRWFWTNNMYNQYFYSVDDFKNLKFELNLDVQAIFESKSNFEWKLNTIDKLMLGTNLSTTASSNIQYIGQDGIPNINMYTVAGLQDDYGCFTLYAGDKLENLENFNLEIYLGNSTITYDTSELKYEFSQEERSLTQEGAKYLSLINQEDTKNKKSGIIENIETSNFSPLGENNERHPDVFGVTSSDFSDNDDEIIDGNTYKKLPTNLSQCYYISENENEKKPIELTLSAALFNNAYTEGEVNTKATAPVYVPFINSELDLKKFGIETIIENNSVKFVFNTGIVLNMKGANSGGYFSGTKLAYEEENPGLFKRAIIDDSLYQFELNKELITTYSNDDFINKIWNNINEDLPQFFLVYFGGIDMSNKYGIFYGENVTSYSDITSWRSKRTNEEILKLFGEKPTDSNELNKWQSYFIPKNAFDIESDADLAKINPGNVVAFLGMKYKDGMTIFNLAYFEHVENENSILQLELLNMSKDVNSPYPNFAYILYLLLSRMYHKNHLRETGEQIALKNHVKLAPYSTTLTKDIITKLSVKDSDDINELFDKSSLILMSGIKYNDYLSEIYNKHINTLILNELNELTNIHTNQTELDIAVTPTFTDVAKNNQLTLNIKSSSLDFPDQEDKGFIEYNGSIKICDNLGENKFYIYNVTDTIPTDNSIPSLYEFNNRSLKIRTSDITANLEYLFPEKTELINSESPLYNSHHRMIGKKEYVKSKDFDELNKINDLWDGYLDQTSGGTKLRDVLEEYLQMCFYDETHASNSLEDLKNKITNLILNGERDEISYSRDIYKEINLYSITEYNLYLSELRSQISLFNSFNKYLENKIILTDTPTFKESLKNCIKNSFVEDTASIQIIYTSSSDIELTGDSLNEVDVIYLKLTLGISLSNLLYKEIDHPSCELYEIQSPELHFTYDSELKIDEVYNYDMFGVTDKIGNHSEGYTGFLRDIVFDNRYKIVP